MDRYLFVVATPKTKEEFEPLWEKNGLSFYKNKEKSDVEVVYENKKGLSEVYNRFITSDYRNRRVVFIHDDLILDDQFILEKLDNAHESWNVVGIAGAQYFRFQKPAMWHLMADLEDGTNHLVGFVAHRLADNKVITNFYGMGNKRVSLIDGLFMSVDVDKVLDKNVKFDENYNFHFYDLTFCVRCLLSGVSIGIGDPIFVTHLSTGQPDQNFYILQERFMQEYHQLWRIEKAKRGL